MKPYYDADGITIYHGDCREVLPQLEQDVDLVFTSPRYNLGTNIDGFGHWRNGGIRGGRGKWAGSGQAVGAGIDYGTHDDAAPTESYEAEQRAVLAACWDLLTDQGAIFYNHKPRVQASTLWLPLALNPGLPVRQIITWARAGGINATPTHYAPTYEWIVVFAKEAFRLKSRAASSVGDLWRVPQEGRNPHPAPFPLGLPARAIETAGSRSVLDPFMGSGTTLRAAKDAGIRAIGIELEERWCEYAASRLAQGVLAL